uniref:helix-turn-helix domain-containing protein n=1 Tax=Saccharothrix sp. TaxID=1873460 RepID=UPI002811F252
RLLSARRQLLAGDATAAQVAHTVGYTSATQFSREYRAFYGLPRSRTSPACAPAPRRPPGTSTGPTGAINRHLEHLRGPVLAFCNLTKYVVGSILKAGR